MGQEIESRKDELDRAREVCKQGLRWLIRARVRNGWPRHVANGTNPDIRATSFAFNALERFSDEFEIRTPYDLPYTRLWLVEQLRDGLDCSPGTADTDTMERVAFAMSVLCRTARRTATFWLRNSIHWLLMTDAGDTKQDSQYRHALRFYGVVELLRRRDCVHILRQLL